MSTLDARSLIMHPRKGSDEASEVEMAIRLARECARHKVPLPAEHVAKLLRHVETVHGAAVTADRFFRNLQLIAQPVAGARRQWWVARVPWDAARRMRNQLRVALGWKPVLADEEGVL